MIAEEHGISKSGNYIGDEEDQLSRSDVYFREGKEGIYIPRSVMVDLEPGTLDNIKSSPMGKLFRPNNFIGGSGGAGNIWAKGKFFFLNFF